MALELAAIAASAIGSFVLPLLKKGADTMAQELAQGIGEAGARSATGIAQKVWSRIKAAFRSPREQTAIERFEEDPELYAQPVQVLLEQRLAADHELLADLTALLEQPVEQGQAWQIMAENVGIVTMHQSRFEGGQQVIGGIVHGAGHDRPPAPDARTDEPGRPHSAP